tara:strand:+ start:363 stop:965 length:603 start_codon:yes stop_codon:yes gene_type:complete
MPNYVQDSNDSKKQVPGPLPDNYYGRAGIVSNVSESISGGGTGLNKTPNSVFINSLTGNVGFFFGSSASFATLDLNLTGNGKITASNGSKQISGSGTSFTTELVAGDKIEIVSASFKQVHIIDSISSSISMSVTTNWGGNTHSESAITRRRSFMSGNYENYGKPAVGTELNIHPTAYSGSSGDKVVFIYKGGLDGSPRPF